MGASASEIWRSVQIGDIVTGAIVDTGGGTTVRLDGDLASASTSIDDLGLVWSMPREDFRAGRRITAEVTAVDAEIGRISLSLAATENPELWAFLKNLRRGEVLGGTVAAIHNFGVFVELDDCPPHPVYPGVGFLTLPELSWRHNVVPTDVVEVGQRIRGEFLQFDTWNGEARMSLRALEPDPLQTIADEYPAGRRFSARVTETIPFGVFVEVADGIEGLVHKDELGVDEPDGFVRPGDVLEVVIREVDRDRRRIALGLARPALPPR